jgi:hypothetical protein
MTSSPKLTKAKPTHKNKSEYSTSTSKA